MSGFKTLTDRLSRNYFSMLTTGILLVIFAVAIAYATFIENSYGTSTARILVYNALWFEILLFLLAVNLLGSILYNKLIHKKKWAVFIFHFAFLIILTGAAITRFTGLEGSIHIREGEQSNQLLTDATYIRIHAVQGNEKVITEDEVRFSPYTRSHFRKTIKIGEREIIFENLRYVPSAVETVVEDPAGEPIIALLAVSEGTQRSDFLLRKNGTKEIGGLLFGFDNDNDSVYIKIHEEDGQLFLECRDTIFSTGMEQSSMAKLEPGKAHPFPEKAIFQVSHIGFVLKKYIARGKPQLVYVPSHSEAMPHDALDARITTENESKEIFVYGNKGESGQPAEVTFNDLKVNVSYGSVVHELPFQIKLNDFQIERYPGSNSPSSFASEVTLIDKNKQVEKPFRIFMNNILKYKGYRFFQSSFDKDEKGTVLSVNYDWWGTFVTYTGYLILVIGMILTLFSRRSRFSVLARSLSRMATERKKLFSGLLLAGLFISSLAAGQTQKSSTVSPEHAREFGKLLVQNNEGRIEPVTTLASEVLRKVAKKSSYDGMDPVQVMLEMICEPNKWKNTPIIRVSSPELRKELGLPDKYAAFAQLFTEDGTNDYKLGKLITKAYEKKPSQRNKFDKEVINVDERVNILYKFLDGGFLTIFPMPGDSTHKWLAPQEAAQSGNEEVADFSKGAIKNYVASLQSAKLNGDYTEANRLLNIMKDNQKKLGAAIYPPVIKTNLEIFYVEFNLFSKLAKIYILVGLLLLGFQLYSLMSSSGKLKMLNSTGFWVVFLLFIIHSAGLGIRWYISGHAPWSNGYETLIYISWATCMAGLIFSGRSPMTLAMTTILSAIALFVAGMSWMSPELTNLVPVLKSYWLVIHVAVITASYGFFAMAALLGILNLVLIIVRPSQKNPKINFTIRELELIIEIAIVIGLFMLTVGSFLGGVWANESWGRYWGWDPKETWALVTVLVYAFIAHMHHIPGFRGAYAVSVASLIGLSSVLMTFFGVNYYLSGLHSYAQGEPAPVPTGVYIAVGTLLILALAAYFADRKAESETQNAGLNHNRPQ